MIQLKEELKQIEDMINNEDNDGGRIFSSENQKETIKSDYENQKKINEEKEENEQIKQEKILMEIMIQFQIMNHFHK